MFCSILHAEIHLVLNSASGVATIIKIVFSIVFLSLIGLGCIFVCGATYMIYSGEEARYVIFINYYHLNFNLNY